MKRDLAGDVFLPEGLTGFSDDRPKRGRPKAISDDELNAAYSDLISVLSQCWATVGWELQNATTVSQVREAFKRIKGITCTRLEVFMREETSPATGRQISLNRAKLQTLSEEIYKAYQTRRERAEMADWAKRAVEGARSPYQAKELRPKAKVRHQMLYEANELVANLTEEIDGLRRRVEQQEAYFAQDQILKFMLSGQRALAPRSFAAAMAGLPFISWRQSCERCADNSKLYPESFSYKMFIVVARLCTKAPYGPGPLVEGLRTYICEPMRDDADACQHLRDNWYFLEAAVRSVFEKSIAPVDSLPYRIFAEYQHRWQHQSPTDVLRNEERRL